MNKRRLMIRTIILAILIGALGFTFYTNFFTSKAMVEVGDQAPDFVLTSLDGKTYQLSELRGQGVFLNFWGTWCPPCKEEMPYMENQYQVFKDRGVEIIAVDIDESELAVKSFVDRYGLTFPVVIDEGEVVNAYDIGPLPTTFLIDENGKIVKKITGRMDEADIKRYMELIEPN
jgi:peroxiredoxin